MTPSKWIEGTEAIGIISNTIGAVTGGLAGILWDIPKKWINKLKNKECIEKCLFSPEQVVKLYEWSSNIVGKSKMKTVDVFQCELNKKSH